MIVPVECTVAGIERITGAADSQNQDSRMHR